MDDMPTNEPDDRTDPTEADGLDDPVLEAAGRRLREGTGPLSADAVRASVYRRRSRRLGVLAGASLLAATALGAVAVTASGDGDGGSKSFAGSTGTASAADPDRVDELVASLGDGPVDPTTVRLVRNVSTFADCDALVDDLRVVGARHVGSQGFGGFSGYMGVGYAAASFEEAAVFSTANRAMPELAYTDGDGGAGGETLGTNVQVEGVDELDHVKAVDGFIYDLDRKGDLRITRASDLTVLATLDVTPGQGSDSPYGIGASVQQILVSEGRVAIFGTETEVSDPVEGDPSATRATTQYMTIAFADVTDPEAPALTDRVRVEGRLVSARLVGSEIRMVTTSDMADLGFVMPTTPNSVPKALDTNRRAVASSTAADWIPDWQRDGEDPQPLVPCERVHVPETFAGVAMTSMVTIPIDRDLFQATGTSILAPGDTLYAGLDTVAISSNVWVDPIDRDRLEFDNWQTAIHEFSFAAGEAPGYEGTGIVDGSTVGQFAFGEIGDALGVVTSAGTPWRQDLKVGVELNVLARDGEGGLTRIAGVEDLSDGKSSVAAVRFTDGRVLVSTGFAGRRVEVIDVSDPAAPRRAGNITLPGTVGYFHPLPDDKALMIGSRSDTVGTEPNERHRNWVQAHLLDVSDPDAPEILSTWENPWSSDMVSYDHHAFTYWPDRNLAMWGLQNENWPNSATEGNHAAVIEVDDAINEVAVVSASKPEAVDPPCGIQEVPNGEVEEMLGRDTVILRCDDPAPDEIDWPRYSCGSIERGMVETYYPEAPDGTYYMCNPTGPPTVSRVLVVEGTPILLTDQTMERLDPETFASTQIAYMPGSGGMYYW